MNSSEPRKVNVYRGHRLIGTFNCHEAATDFIMSEYSAEEADRLDVHTEESYE